MPKSSFMFSLLLLISCVETPIESNKNNTIAIATSKQNSIEHIPIDTSTHHIYPWLEKHDIKNNLTNQIPVPEGFKRTALTKNSFSDWLRHLPLKAKNTKVLLHNGKEKHNQNVHFRVIDIDTGKRDLQQCADATMRLKADYHYSQKEYDDSHFNFTTTKYDDETFNSYNDIYTFILLHKCSIFQQRHLQG